MATSSLTPADLDAIRLILREELDAHGRETVPPEPLSPEVQQALDAGIESAKTEPTVARGTFAKQPGDRVGPDDVDVGDVVREHHSDGTIDIQLRRRIDAGAWSGVAVAGTGAYPGTTSACMAFFGLYTSTTLVSRATAEQPASTKRPEWATKEGIRWLRSVANGMRGFMSDETMDEMLVADELRRRVPDVARAMLAEVETK